MLKIVKTKWRPLIELTEVDVNDDDTVVETGRKFHLNVLKIPAGIITGPDWTVLIYDHFQVFVKESAKEIYKTVDKMVDDEAKLKIKEAEEYRAATEARASKYAEGKA